LLSRGGLGPPGPPSGYAPVTNRRLDQVHLHSGTLPVGLYGDLLLYAAIQMEYATMMMVMTMMSACSVD